MKYPYVRGPLLDLWREAKQKNSDPIKAWESLVTDPQKRSRIQKARGKGGYRRARWDDVVELVAAASLYTARRWGPDRVMGFSPIPAMSMCSYAAGSRFLQLFGGVNMSFYDWYADLPTSFPEIWGDQTDVCESADWYNSKFVVSMAANLNMTRTPDVHFISEARTEGTKFVVLAPDFNQVAKYCRRVDSDPGGSGHGAVDGGQPRHPQRILHRPPGPVLRRLCEALHRSPVPGRAGARWEAYRMGRLLRAKHLARYKDIENGDWKMLVLDAKSGEPRVPKGQVGDRWGSVKGKWNLSSEDTVDNSPIEPVLSFIDQSDEVVLVGFDDFVTEQVDSSRRAGQADRHRPRRGGGHHRLRHLDGAVRPQPWAGWKLPVELRRRRRPPIPRPGRRSHTGIGRETAIRFAREFARNAELTFGKSMVIVGASANHFYYNNLCYRSATVALILCGCCGVNGGGINHYVGQEKLAPIAPWNTLAMALDWVKPPRVVQSSTWHYAHSCQWRYEQEFTEYAKASPNPRWAKGHAIDLQAKAVRLGWMPFTPHFNKNPLDIVSDADRAGAKTDADVISSVVQQIKDKKINFAIDDPDAEESWPRVWFIWRGNAIQSSAKGHEYFLRHYLGTHDNAIAEDRARGKTNRVKYRDTAPRGKYDLVVDLNFRMDTSALYSDIVLPAAFWYEKNDLNTTDLHSFLHVLGAGGAAGVGIQDGLGDLQAVREEGQRAFAARVLRADARHHLHAAHARYAGRIGAARDSRLGRGRVRADTGQDLPASAGSRARLRQPVQQVHLVRAACAGRRPLGCRRADPDQETVRPDARESDPADARSEAHALCGVGWQTVPQSRGRPGRGQHYFGVPRPRPMARSATRPSITKRSMSVFRWSTSPNRRAATR